jgi:transposase InsO family protein
MKTVFVLMPPHFSQVALPILSRLLPDIRILTASPDQGAEVVMGYIQQSHVLVHTGTRITRELIEPMTAWLQRQGELINEKRVRRLLRTMGLMALYPGPKTSQSAPAHRIYPYLLREVPITHPDFVWSTDITYIRLVRGFGYLVAIMDWFSR